MAEGGLDTPDYDLVPVPEDVPDDVPLPDVPDPDETRAFVPTSASTPGPSSVEEIEMKTMQKEKSGLPDPSYDGEIPSLGDWLVPEEK